MPPNGNPPRGAGPGAGSGWHNPESLPGLRAWEHAFPASLPRHYLQAGGLLFSHVPCEVTTVLGPCIAVTFFNSRKPLAGICHAMLPAPAAGAPNGPGHPEDWRYVCNVVPDMCRYFREYGLGPPDIEVRLYGGGYLLSGRRPSGPPIGEANVARARQLLTAEGFVVRSADVGGQTGRRIVFDTRTGSVRIRRFAPAGGADGLPVG